MKVSESVSLTLEDFHFGMEAFGDSVVAGEAPHAGDFLAPGIEHIAELHQWREPATTERGDIGQEAACQLLAAFLISPLLEQAVAEPLFEAVNHFQGWVLPQIRRQALVLQNREVVAMAAHQGEQPAVFSSNRVKELPAGQKVMIDGADHVESIGHNLGVGEMLLHQRPVTDRQIHADQQDQILAFEALEIGFQGGLAAAQHDIMHLMVFQVTEGRGIAVPAGEEVFVDAQNLRAQTAGAFSRQQTQIPEKPALHGRTGDPLALPQAAPADAIEMLLANAAPERLGRAQPRLNPRKALPEAAAAGPAQPLARFQFQHAMPNSPAFMPRTAGAPVLRPQLLLAAMRAANLPGKAHRNANLTADFLNGGNLIIGQAQ